MGQTAGGQTHNDPGSQPSLRRGPERNQLANCMLLTREENGAGGKGSMSPEDWFAGESQEYLQKHLIPADSALWALGRFEEFIEARKELIRRQFGSFLVGRS